MSYTNKNVTTKMWVLYCISTFILVMFIGSYNKNKLLPEIYIENLSEKIFQIKYMDIDKLDGIFLGTSTMHRGINPELLQDPFNNDTCRFEFYNFGIPGMSSALYVKVLNYLNSNIASKKILYIEPEFAFGEFKNFSVSDRALYTYNLETVIFGFLQIITRDDRNFVDRLKMIVYLIRNYIVVAVGIGSLRREFFENTFIKLDNIKLKHFNNGYFPLDYEVRYTSKNYNMILEKKRRKYLDKGNQEKFKDNVEKLKKELNKNTRKIYYFERIYIDKIIKKARSKYMEIRFLFMPTRNYKKIQRLKAWKNYIYENYPEIEIININPINTPELYKIHLWYNFSHLNSDGAEVLSRKIGEIICEQGIDS